MVIYIDILIFLNFIVNYCFMKLIYLIFNEKVNKIRLILSSVVSIILLFSFLFDYIIFNIIKILGGLLLVFIAFKYSNKKRFVIMTCLYYILQFSFIGVLSIFNIKGCTILLFLLFICLLILVYSKKNLIYNNKNYRILCKLVDEYIEIDGFIDTGNRANFNEYPIVFLDKKYYSKKLSVFGVGNIKTVNGIEFINCYKPKEFYIIDKNKKISKDVLIAFSNFNNEFNCLLNYLMFNWEGRKMLGGLLKFVNKLFGNKECFYINSTNILPPPLSDEEEEKYLIEFKNGDIESRNKLITHNLRLVVYIAKKFESTKINIEDLISIGSMGLIKAVQTFKLEKNIKLATYASRCIENEILMHLRKTQKSRQDVSLDEVLNVDSEGNEMVLADILCSNDDQALDEMTKAEDERKLFEAIELLSKKEKEIISMRYGLFGKEEMTQKEVADLMGISQSYISRLEKRIIDKIRHYVNEEIKLA